MKKVFVSSYIDQNLIVLNGNLSEYTSNDGEVLSGVVTPLKSTVDLQGSIGIYRFQIAIGNYSFSADHQQLIIPYTGYGNTALVANLTTYEYSLDGSTWLTMTAAAGTVVTSLNFTPSGGSFTFTWVLKDDLGDNIYNKDIYIRFQATSDTLQTTMVNTSVYFSKIIVNEATARNTPKLPGDYSGISGSDLLVNAPKIKK